MDSARGCTSWVEVDIGALEHNFEQVRQLVGPDVKIMAVVKADAYGHGAVEAAKCFSEAGAHYLGVTTLEEGLELRSAGITSPILVFSPLHADQMEYAVSADLDQAISSLDTAKALSAAAQKVGQTARVQVQIDTGMGRLGMPPAECPGFVSLMSGLPGLKLTGTYTHFANASARDLSHAGKQLHRFTHFLEFAETKGIELGLRHAANSAALLNFPSSHLDMVRPGTILYGQYPSSHVQRKLDVRDTWQLKTRIVYMRKFVVGETIGYGSEYTVRTAIKAAVIPIGYSDGFTLIPESVARRTSASIKYLVGKLIGNRTGGASVIIHGKHAPVLGRVSMQLCSVDVTGIPEAQVGDEVIVPSRRTSTSSRIPRIYVRR